MSEKILKRFQKGDIVYWCHHDGYRYYVKYGIVDEQWHDGYVFIDFLTPRDRRRVNGVPINQFVSEEKYRKLPQGWTYNTRLYELTEDDLTEEEKSYVWNVKDPDCIKTAYDKGFLIEEEKKFWGTIEAEINANGYRIRKKFPMWQTHINDISLHWRFVYKTYDEAQAKVDENINEFNRQANLSDYDWSIEQIEKTIKLWQRYHSASDDEVKVYKEEFLNMEDVENIETRFYQGTVQWKNIKNKKWNNMIL